MNISSVKFNSDWITGQIENLNFEAKVNDTDSRHGIDSGRISKLAIWDEKVRWEKLNFIDACVAHFDRGWDVKPQTPLHQKMVAEVVNFCGRFSFSSQIFY